jgi:hypothetical protein
MIPVMSEEEFRKMQDALKEYKKQLDGLKEEILVIARNCPPAPANGSSDGETIQEQRLSLPRSRDARISWANITS